MANSSIYAAFEKLWKIVQRKVYTKEAVDSALANKAGTDHNHSDATVDVAGFMPKEDKKYIDRIKPVELNIRGKTIPEIQEIFNDWLTTASNYQNACAFFSSTIDLVNYWNADNTTDTVSGGQQWGLEVEAPYYLTDYVLLKLTSYSNKLVYYVARMNKVWQKIYQVSFTDHTHAEATTTAAGFMPADDKKYLEMLKSPRLEKVSDKTIPEFQAMLLEWRNNNNKIGARATFITGTTFINLWNNSDTTTTLGGGTYWTVETVATQTGDYFMLKFTTYMAKAVYYVHCNNGTWGTIYQASFTDHTHTTLTLPNNIAIKSKNNTGSEQNVLKANASNQLVFGEESAWTEVACYHTIRPCNSSSKNVDLGTSSQYWRDLYLSGTLSDGANNVKVADIAKKSDIPTIAAQVGAPTVAEMNAAIAAVLPKVTTADNGKVLRVVDGVWAAVSIPNAEEASF